MKRWMNLLELFTGGGVCLGSTNRTLCAHDETNWDEERGWTTLWREPAYYFWILFHKMAYKQMVLWVEKYNNYLQFKDDNRLQSIQRFCNRMTRKLRRKRESEDYRSDDNESLYQACSCIALTMFNEARVDGFHVVIWNKTASLLRRLRCSSNIFV